MIRTAGVLACLFLFVAAPVHAASPTSTCAAAKHKAAAKRMSDKVKCHGVALKKGTVVDPECLAKADAKFEDAFSKAQLKGGCSTADDADDIGAMIDGTLASLITAVPGEALSCPDANPGNCSGCLTCGRGRDCVAEQAACDADPYCDVFRSCNFACTTEACIRNCETVYPGGAALWYTSIECLLGVCGDVCGTCGDNICAAGESPANCARDCGCSLDQCGDGTCDHFCETLSNCPADCGSLAGWTCNPVYYSDADCDCGCGIVDPACATSAWESCDYCRVPGGCGADAPDQFCPGWINPTDNSQCIVP